MFALKRVLITGANSYVGTNVEKRLMSEPDKYYVETLDMKDQNWKSYDFSRFDVVFHVAGIVHKKESKKIISLYYKVNRDLTIELAEKVKNAGVKLFIFMSTMAIYGIDSGTVTEQTTIIPKTHYGKSKYDAENGITKLNDSSFSVIIVRPPIIYGQNSKGNYEKLQKLARIIAFFPEIDNRRRMISIENLSEKIEYYIRINKSGIYFPYDKNYIRTLDLLISFRKNRKFYVSKVFAVLIKLLSFSRIYKKIFGNYIYDLEYEPLKSKPEKIE